MKQNVKLIDFTEKIEYWATTKLIKSNIKN